MPDSSLTRVFAIVPAAGRSVRMGVPKLLLPWGVGTVLDAVLSAWRASRVTATIVVVHPDDEAIADVARRHGADVVVAQTAPPDMKASVTIGLQYVRRQFQPQPDDWWLLAPADMPGLSSKAIDAVILAANTAVEPIVVPTYNGQRGHPVAFRWHLAGKVAELASNEGVNALVGLHAVRYIEVNDRSIVEDLDTPEDYSRHVPPVASSPNRLP